MRAKLKVKSNLQRPKFERIESIDMPSEESTFAWLRYRHTPRAAASRSLVALARPPRPGDIDRSIDRQCDRQSTERHSLIVISSTERGGCGGC